MSNIPGSSEKHSHPASDAAAKLAFFCAAALHKRHTGRKIFRIVLKIRVRITYQNKRNFFIML